MIVGEGEVQGQVRRAHEAALAAGTTGPFTNRLFRAALQTGKRVRTETALGSARVSVPSVAVDLAREAVGDLGDRSVLIIGAGETAELTARALHEQGVSTMFVANRRADRARALAERFGGRVGSLDELPDRLVDADIVVASTSSPHPIVGTDELRVVMDARGGRPIVLIDIAVPRDIEHGCGDIEGVALYDMDDLQGVLARNLDVREGDRASAEELVEDEIDRFSTWMAQQGATPTISALREHGTAIVDQVLAENAGRWESASPARRRADRGGRARGHAADAARADDPDEGAGARRRPRSPGGAARAVRSGRGPGGGSRQRRCRRRRHPVRRARGSPRAAPPHVVMRSARAAARSRWSRPARCPTRSAPDTSSS